MKIYNEVITQFNDITGQWETMYEDSFEYNGSDIMLAQGTPPNSSPINISDTIADTIKTTAGYFTNGDGTIDGNSIFTGSLADSNEKYYFNVNHLHPLSSSTETQFAVVYADARGSGSDTYGDSSNNPNTLNGSTQAIYTQLSQLLLTEVEQSGGFKIGQSGTHRAGLESGQRDDFIYALVFKRERFKDRVNKKVWTLSLSGSNNVGTRGTAQNFTDDSSTVTAVATPGGPRYNIVSGSLGSVYSGQEASVRTMGWFYPEMGIMLFSGAQLSESIGGPGGTNYHTASLITDTTTTSTTVESSSGFAPSLSQKGNAKNALRIAQCMRNMGSSTTLRLRSEEDQTQENYFCRIKAEEYNFTANPTFVSGSKNKIRNLDMHGNPQTFITGVGLYNSAGQLLAIAKLSSPLKKNFASEATVKVKLTY